MVTQLESDVEPPPTRRLRPVRLSVAGLQSAGAGSGLDTTRSTFVGHRL